MKTAIILTAVLLTACAPTQWATRNPRANWNADYASCQNEAMRGVPPPAYAQPMGNMYASSAQSLANSQAMLGSVADQRYYTENCLIARGWYIQ